MTKVLGSLPAKCNAFVTAWNSVESEYQTLNSDILLKKKENWAWQKKHVTRLPPWVWTRCDREKGTTVPKERNWMLLLPQTRSLRERIPKEEKRQKINRIKIKKNRRIVIQELKSLSRRKWWWKSFYNQGRMDSWQWCFKTYDVPLWYMDCEKEYVSMGDGKHTEY